MKTFTVNITEINFKLNADTVTTSVCSPKGSESCTVLCQPKAYLRYNGKQEGIISVVNGELNYFRETCSSGGKFYTFS